jgi:hypothetical protein
MTGDRMNQPSFIKRLIGTNHSKDSDRAQCDRLTLEGLIPQGNPLIQIVQESSRTPYKKILHIIILRSGCPYRK